LDQKLINQAAIAAAFRLLRELNKPITQRPVASKGRAAGSGVAKPPSCLLFSPRLSRAS
jgi:hypothetical protein